MNKHLQSFALPILMMTSATLLLGCEPSPHQNTEQSSSSNSNHDDNQQRTNSINSENDFKSGNLFYIARDVADVQLKTGDYIEKLQQLQTDVKQAIDAQDQQNLQTTVKDLNLQLRGFNEALTSLNLKSEEINSIRQQVLQANKQVLSTPLLNGELDMAKIDFKKIEQQMNIIQLDMLNLAQIVLPNSNSDQQESSSNEGS